MHSKNIIINSVQHLFLIFCYNSFVLDLYSAVNEKHLCCKTYKLKNCFEISYWLINTLKSCFFFTSCCYFHMFSFFVLCVCVLFEYSTYSLQYDKKTFLLELLTWKKNIIYNDFVCFSTIWNTCQDDYNFKKVVIMIIQEEDECHYIAVV